MNPEIDRLITIAIADGEISEKERGIILRKAELLGLDKDEVEMIMDGELALIKKESQKANQILPKSNKEGYIRKCPSCGASVPSFTSKCSDCGLEFRGTEATHSVKQLSEQLINIENEERARPLRKYGFWEGGQAMGYFLLESAIANRIAAVISSFPIPNTKEDILEFLSQSISKSETKSYFQIQQVDARNNHNKVAYAWKNKCQEIIMKARFSMKDDKGTLSEIEHYARQLNIK